MEEKNGLSNSSSTSRRLQRDTVYQLLLKNLGETESIDDGTAAYPNLDLANHPFVFCFDIHLKQGFGLLGWPENTAVEVKQRFIYDTFTRIVRIRNLCKNGGAIINKLVVIVMDKDFRKEIFVNESLTDIEIIKYDDFFEKLSKALAKQKTPSSCFRSEVRGERKFGLSPRNAWIMEKLKWDVKRNKVTFFLGAGVSASAGVTAWNGLIEQLCVKKKIPKIDSDFDNVVKGRIIVNSYNVENQDNPQDEEENKRLEEYQGDIQNILYSHIHDSDLIAALADVIQIDNIESVISYNYDDLLEQELRNKTRKCYPVYGKSRPEGMLPIYHVHGFIPQSSGKSSSLGEKEYSSSPIVLGEKEYHKIYQEPYNWGNIEQLHALNRNTCVFIGLSMTDPNLRRLLDTSWSGSEGGSVHYVFLRKIEHNVELMNKIMDSFGVNCIWYNEHSELPKMLKSLTSK